MCGDSMCILGSSLHLAISYVGRGAPAWVDHTGRRLTQESTSKYFLNSLDNVGSFRFFDRMKYPHTLAVCTTAGMIAGE